MERCIAIAADARLLINRDQLDLKTIELLRAEFTHQNPVRVKKQRMGFWTGNDPVTLCSMRIEEPFLSLPRGALPRVREILEGQGYKIDRINDRSLKLPRLDFQLQRELRPYQRDAVEALVRSGNGVLRGPCGSGKTNALLGAIAALRQPTLVLVHTEALMNQWLSRTAEWLGVVPGNIGGKRKENLRPVTIAMLQTVHKKIDQHPEWLLSFGCLVADEIQHLPAVTWSAIVNRFPAAYRIGASADERRKDGLEFMIYDVIGPCVYVIEKQALLESNQLMPIEMHLVRTGYEDEVFVENFRSGMYSDWNRMLERLTDDEDRFELVMDTAQRILREDPGNRVLVLSERVEYCNMFHVEQNKRGVECGLMIGGAEHRNDLERSIALLRSGGLRLAVGTKVADEGLDIPQLTHVLVTCPLHTHPKRLTQMTGRAARTAPGKRHAVCVYFWDEKIFPGASKSKLDHVRAHSAFLRKLRPACNSIREWNPKTGVFGSPL